MADPMTAERLAKAVEQRPDRYRTHWEGCETDVKHGDCAIRFLLGQLSAAQQEIAALREAAERLYCAGRWDCDTVPPDVAAQLWEALRRALGLPAGTATRLGVAALAPRTPGEKG